MRKSLINFNLYKTFVEVYETKNLSVAAHNLKLTQPTITYNIKELERQHGVRLFNSNSRGVEPTANADEMYPLLREGITFLLNAEDAVKELNETSQGVVRICLSQYITDQSIAQSIALFNKKYPNIKLEINKVPYKDAMNTLAKYNTDLVICAKKPAPSDDDIFVTLLAKELKNTLFVGKEFANQHNLQGKVTLEQIRKLPMILFNKTFTTRQELEQLDFIRKSNPLIEVNSMEVMYHLVSSNIGIGFGDEEFLNNLTDITKIELADVKTPTFYLCFRYNKNMANKAAVELISIFKKEFNIK